MFKHASCLNTVSEKLLIQFLIFTIAVYLIPNHLAHSVPDWLFSFLEFLTLIVVFYLIYRFTILKLSKPVITIIIIGLLLFALPSSEPSSSYDWIMSMIMLAGYVVGVVLICKRIFVGHFIVLYITYLNLSLMYAVFNSFFSWYFFTKFPNLIFYNAINMIVGALSLIDLALIVIKYMRPQMFQHTASSLLKGSTLKRYQLDIALASMFLVLLVVYWLAAWIVHKG